MAGSAEYMNIELDILSCGRLLELELIWNVDSFPSTRKLEFTSKLVRNILKLLRNFKKSQKNVR